MKKRWVGVLRTRVRFPAPPQDQSYSQSAEHWKENMSENTYRSAKGRRLDGSALAARVAQELNGMLLAQAFIVAKSAGFRLRVNKLDGVPRETYVFDDTVHVDVIGGFVRKSWI